VSGGHSFAEVRQAFLHACGRTTGAGLYCWGGTMEGFLGNGQMGWREVPTRVGGAQTYTQVASGIGSACAITSTGGAECWGSNNAGQLGDGTTVGQSLPVPVSGTSGWSSLDAGFFTTCGVRSGSGWCWGEDLSGFGPVSVPTAVPGSLTFSRVESTGSHACGLTPTGELYCWGSNAWGQLGDRSMNARSAPTLVAGGHVWAEVAIGERTSCALDTAGAAFCWGSDGAGGTQAFPALMDSTLRFTAIAVNHYNQACAVSATQEMWCWSGSAVFSLVPGGHQFIAVTLGSIVTCGLTPQGQALCWGVNSFGDVGDGTRIARFTPTPVSGGLSFTQLSAGNIHVCGITTEEGLYCWGGNAVGELGLGLIPTSLLPVQVW
jgi:alpha-tubulin suppressor-like RCC1 family protein